MLAWTIYLSFPGDSVSAGLLARRGSPMDNCQTAGGEPEVPARQIDFNRGTNDKGFMSTAKKASSKPSRRARESKTWGTRMGAEIRARCNKLTRAEREALLERAMQLAYGADTEPAPARRR